MSSLDSTKEVSSRIWHYHTEFPYTGESVHTSGVMALKNVIEPVYTIADALHDSIHITFTRHAKWMELYRLPI